MVDDFGRLLIEQIPRLRRYARSLTGNPALADDLVQDCLDRAWGRMGHWQPGSNLRAWLFTIMHNQFVNRVRRESRVDWEALEGREPADTTAPSPDSELQLRDLQAGLAALPGDQREVLLLVTVEGMSYQQVAEVLNVPIGTVMSRLHRARERLRRWMAGEVRPKLRRVK